ncbi:MAG: phosphate starvation-inducible protein PsiF [Polaromonas sp.]|nr:phosphate starvation-inducible protein PsiF [Polaromonas sp.]
MKKQLSLIAVCAALVAGFSPAVQAASHVGAAPAASAPTKTAQQSKMSACNTDAKTKALKGDERKAFMKDCLSASPAAAAVPATQQGKMTTCNADAKTKALKGDERKAFMKSCLSA